MRQEVASTNRTIGVVASNSSGRPAVKLPSCTSALIGVLASRSSRRMVAPVGLVKRMSSTLSSNGKQGQAAGCEQERAYKSWTRVLGVRARVA